MRKTDWESGIAWNEEVEVTQARSQSLHSGKQEVNFTEGHEDHEGSEGRVNLKIWILGNEKAGGMKKSGKQEKFRE